MLSQIEQNILDEILRIEHLTKHFIKKSVFRSKRSIVRATDDISFSVKKGEVFVLAGESGSGKSTIAKLILKSIESDSGKIIFEGEEIKNDSKSLTKIRMQCQMIHQDPYDSINPRMKISDIISEPLEIHNFGTKDERKQRVIEVLSKVDHMRKEFGITIILVEQNVKRALKMADMVYLLANGKLVFKGKPDELLKHPELGKLYLGISK